jgi:hypothetical protein
MDDLRADVIDQWDLFTEAYTATGCPTGGDALAPVRHLGSLQVLILARSTIADGDLRHLRDLPHLSYLDLRETTVTDAGLAELKHLTGLVHLDLTGTQVSDAGLEHLRALPKLGWLNLNGTQVSRRGLLNSIASINSLQVLYVERTRVLPQEAAALNRALSPCMVFAAETEKP